MVRPVAPLGIGYPDQFAATLATPGRAPYADAMDLDFTEDEIRRYSRHILLQDVGGIGQAKLKAARVLVIGAGGLGSTLALYLSAPGGGTPRLLGPDRKPL